MANEDTRVVYDGPTCPHCHGRETRCCQVLGDMADCIKALVELSEKDYLSPKRRDVLNWASRVLLRAGRG